MQKHMVKRLALICLLSGIGAFSTIVVQRIATAIWVRVFDEDPPD
jgi:hypothetical protein